MTEKYWISYHLSTMSILTLRQTSQSHSRVSVIDKYYYRYTLLIYMLIGWLFLSKFPSEVDSISECCPTISLPDVLFAECCLKVSKGWARTADEFSITEFWNTVLTWLLELSTSKACCLLKSGSHIESSKALKIKDPVPQWIDEHVLLGTVSSIGAKVDNDTETLAHGDINTHLSSWRLTFFSLLIFLAVLVWENTKICAALDRTGFCYNKTITRI